MKIKKKRNDQIGSPAICKQQSLESQSTRFLDDNPLQSDSFTDLIAQCFPDFDHFNELNLQSYQDPANFGFDDLEMDDIVLFEELLVLMDQPGEAKISQRIKNQKRNHTKDWFQGLTDKFCRKRNYTVSETPIKLDVKEYTIPNNTSLINEVFQIKSDSFLWSNQKEEESKLFFNSMKKWNTLKNFPLVNFNVFKEKDDSCLNSVNF